MRLKPLAQIRVWAYVLLVVVGTIFCAAYLMIQLQTKPYLHESDDYFALASSFSMLVLFLCCMVYKYDALTSEASVIDKMVRATCYVLLNHVLRVLRATCYNLPSPPPPSHPIPVARAARGLWRLFGAALGHPRQQRARFSRLLGRDPRLCLHP